jgi:hypothetical protein
MKETKGIHPSVLLARDFLTRPSPETPEGHAHFLEDAIPRSPKNLEQLQDTATVAAREAWDKLVQAGLTCPEISSLLNATAEELHSRKYYSIPAVKMRLVRHSKRLV